jgi:hypothetical protein
MSSRVAAGDQHLAGLALIAPPDLARLAPSTETRDRRPHPSGRRSRGPVLPPDALTALSQTLPHATLTIIDATDHFFFTALQSLTTALSTWARKVKARASE